MRTPAKNSILLCCICISTALANAQTSFSSLEDIWKYADAHNIQVKTAEAQKKIAATTVKQAYGSLLPVVTANGGFTDNVKILSTLVPAHLFNPAIPEGTYLEAKFGRRYNYNGNITAQLDLLNTQDWFDVKVAKLNDELAALGISKAKQDLYQQLASAYFSCLLLAEAEKLSQENVTACISICNIAKNKFAEGLISEITVNTALINKEKAEKNLAIATQNKWLQLNNIRSLLNIQDSLTLPGNTPLTQVRVESTLFSKDPSTQIAYTQMQLALNKWNSSKAAYAPTLTAVYQYSTQVVSDEFFKFSNSNTIPQQYWGLRLSMPIFTGNTRKYEVQNARQDYTLKQQQYESAKLQTDISNQNLLIACNSSLNAFLKSKDILALYQKNDAHAERKMNEGVISLDDRMRSYTDLTGNQQEYLQSMSDYFIQEYSLKIRQTNLIQ